jgi:hypothetical protein
VQTVQKDATLPVYITSAPHLRLSSVLLRILRTPGHLDPNMTPLIWTTRRAKPHSDIKSEAAAQQPDLARAGRLETVCIEEWDSTTFQSIAASVETLLDDPEAKLQETVHTIKEAMVDIARQAGKPRTQYQTKYSGLWMPTSVKSCGSHLPGRTPERLGKVHNMFRWTDEMMRATKVWKEGDNEDEWNLHDPRMVEGDNGKWEIALPRFRVGQPEPVTNLYLRDLRLGPF